MELRDGGLRIGLEEIVAAMDAEQLRDLARTAVFQESLLHGVCDALATGEMFADDEHGPWWWGGDLFDQLRLKLAPLMPAVAEQAVIGLAHERDRARHDRDRWHEACRQLERAWDDAHRPAEQRTNWTAPRMTREQAREYIEQIASAAERRGLP